MLEKLLCSGLGCSHAHNGRIGGFLLLLIPGLPATRSASVMTLGIQDVVRYLKGQAEKFSVAADLAKLFWGCPADSGANPGSRQNQSSGLTHMDIFNRRHIHLSPFGLKVDGLAADQPADTRGMGDLVEHLQDQLWLQCLRYLRA